MTYAQDDLGIRSPYPQFPAKTVGETGLGHRQYIPITGGTVAGPKFNGEVIPGGWDYQTRYGGGCSSLTADYFWRAADDTVIHILNEGLNCAGGESGERGWLRPKFEAPKGPHEWMTKATFVASLELEPPATPPAPGARPSLRRCGRASAHRWPRRRGTARPPCRSTSTA